jgi:hypothetical protein
MRLFRRTRRSGAALDDRPTPAATSLLVPVGHELGAFHAGDGVTEPVQQVRVGAEIADLTDTEFLIWSLTHGLIDEDAQPAPCTRAGLLGCIDEPEVLRSLMGRGLIAEVTPGTAEAVRFAACHRLLPLAMGLGNTAEEPWLFSVGLLDQPLVQMAGALFDVWQWAHLSPDLWTACQEAAAVARNAGAEDPDQIDPDRTLTGVLSALPQLLATRVACFDVPLGGGR